MKSSHFLNMMIVTSSPDNSPISYSDRGYDRSSGRPQVSNPATYCQVRLGFKTLRLPGGKLILFALAPLRPHPIGAGPRLHGLATPIHE